MNTIRLFPALAALMVLCALALPAHAMNKAQLVDQIAKEANISKADALRALEAFVDATTALVELGDRVVLHNFGVFGLNHVIANADGARSLGELDFVAGAAFEDSDEAKRHAFKMLVESAHEAAHVVQQREGVAAMGPGNGSIEVGDLVYLLPGNPSVLAPGRAAAVVPLDLIEAVRPFEIGDVNDDGRIDALDVQLVINLALGVDIDLEKRPDDRPSNPGQGGPVNDQGLRAEVLGVVILDDDGNRQLVRAHRGETIGLLLGGVDKKDIKRGMVIAKPPAPPSSEEPDLTGGVWYDAQGQAAGNLRSDGELVQAMVRVSGLDERIVRAAYNALVNIVVDQVNAGDKVQIIGFGDFISKTRVTVSIIDPCAGDPENCLGDIEDRELLAEVRGADYVAWQMTLEAAGVDKRALARLVEMAARLAQNEIRTGGNPQTGKEVRITAEKLVVLKTFADGSV